MGKSAAYLFTVRLHTYPCKCHCAVRRIAYVVAASLFTSILHRKADGYSGEIDRPLFSLFCVVAACHCVARDHHVDDDLAVGCAVPRKTHASVLRHAWATLSTFRRLIVYTMGLRNAAYSTYVDMKAGAGGDRAGRSSRWQPKRRTWRPIPPAEPPGQRRIAPERLQSGMIAPSTTCSALGIPGAPTLSASEIPGTSKLRNSETPKKPCAKRLAKFHSALGRRCLRLYEARVRFVILARRSCFLPRFPNWRQDGAAFGIGASVLAIL